MREEGTALLHAALTVSDAAHGMLSSTGAEPYLWEAVENLKNAIEQLDAEKGPPPSTTAQQIEYLAHRAAVADTIEQRTELAEELISLGQRVRLQAAKDARDGE